MQDSLDSQGGDASHLKTVTPTNLEAALKKQEHGRSTTGEVLVEKMNTQMGVEIRSPSKSGKYPQYSFQHAIGTREAEIRDKIKSTKEELNEVLNQLDEFERSDEQIDLTRPAEQLKEAVRRREKTDEEILQDDDMADLSPETRALMMKVLNKNEYQRIDSGRMGDLNQQSNKKKQLNHMLSVVKQGIDSR